jgi:hypothetical protein
LPPSPGRSVDLITVKVVVKRLSQSPQREREAASDAVQPGVEVVFTPAFDSAEAVNKSAASWQLLYHSAMPGRAPSRAGRHTPVGDYYTRRAQAVLSAAAGKRARAAWKEDPGDKPFQFKRWPTDAGLSFAITVANVSSRRVRRCWTTRAGRPGWQTLDDAQIDVNFLQGVQGS